MTFVRRLHRSPRPHNCVYRLVGLSHIISTQSSERICTNDRERERDHVNRLRPTGGPVTDSAARVVRDALKTSLRASPSLAAAYNQRRCLHARHNLLEQNQRRRVRRRLCDDNDHVVAASGNFRLSAVYASLSQQANIKGRLYARRASRTV